MSDEEERSCPPMYVPSEIIQDIITSTVNLSTILQTVYNIYDNSLL